MLFTIGPAISQPYVAVIIVIQKYIYYQFTKLRVTLGQTKFLLQFSGGMALAGSCRSSSDKAAVRKLSDEEKKRKLTISAFAAEDPVQVLGNHNRLVHKMSGVKLKKLLLQISVKNKLSNKTHHSFCSAGQDTVTQWRGGSGRAKTGLWDEICLIVGGKNDSN